MSIHKKIIMIIIQILIIEIFGINYAMADSFSIEPKDIEIETEYGNEVSTQLDVANIDIGEHGINVIQGKLEFDGDFFDSVNLVEINDWELTINKNQGERYGDFLIRKMIDGVKTREAFLRVVAKVKSDTTKTQGIIVFKDLKSNNGNLLVDTQPVEIVVKIKKNEEPKPDEPTPDEPQEDPKPDDPALDNLQEDPKPDDPIPDNPHDEPKLEEKIKKTIQKQIEKNEMKFTRLPMAGKAVSVFSIMIGVGVLINIIIPLKKRRGENAKKKRKD